MDGKSSTDGKLESEESSAERRSPFAKDVHLRGGSAMAMRPRQVLKNLCKTPRRADLLTPSRTLWSRNSSISSAHIAPRAYLGIFRPTFGSGEWYRVAMQNLQYDMPSLPLRQCIRNSTRDDETMDMEWTTHHSYRHLLFGNIPRLSAVYTI